MFRGGLKPASALASPDTGLRQWEPVSRWAAHVRWRCPWIQRPAAASACTARTRRIQRWTARGVRLEVHLQHSSTRLLRGATRACLSVTIFAAAAASAQTVVITGAREPLAIERLAADVTVIDAQTIGATRADSLADVLRREAGVQLSRSGGPGQSTGLLIRGTAAQTSVVLVDGVRVGSATLGSTAMEGLGLANVERIEVLRGPGSSLYGADAVGGVVNVITRSGSAGSA